MNRSFKSPKINPPKEPFPPSRPFETLAKGKNKILWGYFGLCDEYPIILSLIKESISFPEISITIASKPNKWVETVSEEEFRSAGEDFMQKIEFKTSPSRPHVFETYTSGLNIKNRQSLTPQPGNLGLLIIENSITRQKLTPEEIKKSENFLLKFGLKVVKLDEVVTIDHVGAVAGVEHPVIWAAIRGRKPTIVPENSVGLNLLTKFGANVIT